MNPGFQTHFTLSLKEWNKFLGHLNEPPKEISELKELFKNYYSVPDSDDFHFDKEKDFEIITNIQVGTKATKENDWFLKEDSNTKLLSHFNSSEINSFLTKRFLRRQ